MQVQTRHRPTIGFICTWPVYQGTTIDRYAHSLIQGINAATKHAGNLLLGCRFSVTGNDSQTPRLWPVPGANLNFIPVGPWNTVGGPDNWSSFDDIELVPGQAALSILGADISSLKTWVGCKKMPAVQRWMPCKS